MSAAGGAPTLSDHAVAARALCRHIVTKAGEAPCRCDDDGGRGCVAEAFADWAGAVVDGLRAAHRMITPAADDRREIVALPAGARIGSAPCEGCAPDA